MIFRRVCAAILVACTLCSTIPASAELLGDIQLHGFASQGYLKSTTYNYLADSTMDGSSEIQEYAFNLSTQVNDDLRVGMQVFARDLGPLGNNELELDWAFGDYRWSDRLGFRIGRVKAPYGLYNETRDFDAVRTFVNLPAPVYNSELRDYFVGLNGLGIYGNVSAGAAGDFDYQAQYGNVQLDPDGGIAFFFNNSGVMTFQKGESNHAANAQFVWNTPVDGLRLGSTWNWFDFDSQVQLAFFLAGSLPPGTSLQQTYTTRNTRYFVQSAEYVVADFVFAAEYQRWLGDVLNPIMGGFSANSDAFYVSGSYRANEWLEAGAYYGEATSDVDENTSNPEHRGYMKDLALALRFDVTPNMIFKVEQHFVDGTYHNMGSINSEATAASWDGDGKWNYFASRVTFVF